MDKSIFKSFFDKKRLLIFVLFAIFIYFYAARLSRFLSNSKFKTEQDSVRETTVSLDMQNSKSFTIIPSNSCWKGITLFFSIPDNTESSLLYLKIADENGKTVFAQAVTELDSEKYHRFSFANKIPAKNGTYTLLISGKNVDLKTNGTDSPQYKLYGNVAGKFLVPIIIIFVIALIVATAVLCFFIFYIKLKPETVFLIAGTIFGLLFMCLMPPLTIGDECRHYDTAYEMSNKMLGVKSAPGFIAKRATDLSLVPDDMFLNDNHTLFNYYETIWPHVFNELQKPKDLSITNAYPYANTITTYPFLFILSSLGITVGRLLKLNFLFTFLLGRFFNLAFFILVTYFALKKQIVAKNFFCFSALLPMLLHQVASFSYDSMLITVSLFFIMSVTEFAYNPDKKLSIPSFIILCLSAFFIAPAKTLYFPIIALIFTINSKSFKQSKNWLLLPTLVILSAVLGVITNHCISRMMTFVNNPVTGIGSTLPSLESVNNYDSLKYLSKTSVLWIVSHPFQYIYILLNSCRERLSYWIMTLGGRYLGWEAIPMNELLIYSMCGMIVWQLVRKTDGIKTTLKNRIISIAIFVTIFLLILTGQFMMGIDPISPVIVGVQGRYLIPIVPLIFLFRKDISTSCEDTELSIHFAQIGILLFLSIDLFFRIIGIY
ncbi:MAG: DUF2142 domain-containing protein [Spirochaetaceae bacterium]|nr:DUF2142 domain-containing protein [Spirochaetaceae bacterium]